MNQNHEFNKLTLEESRSDCIFSTSWSKRKLVLLTTLFLCIGLFVISNVNQANAEASITLSPISGAPGTIVTVSGRGFAIDTRAAILLDGKPLIETLTSATGIFTQKISIPTTAEQGYHRIIGSDGTNSIDAIFTVTSPPAITMSPDQATVGNMVNVSGSNFGAGKGITIKFDGLEIATIPSNLLSSGAGTFSATISIPSTRGGIHTISVTDGVLLTSEIINIREAASITLSSTFGPAGTLVTVTGTEFSPNSAITIKMDSTRLITTPASIITSSSGTLSALITIPIGVAQGSSVISATDDFGRVGSAAFSITASGVVALTPASGYVSAPVTISGLGFSPNSIVTIRLGSTVLATPTITTNMGGTFSGTITIPTSMEAGSYIVYATDESERTGFTVFNVTAPDPLILSRNLGISGSLLNISGNGFSPNSSITMMFDSTTLLSIDVTTNNLGSFQTSITIPDDIFAGSHTILTSDASGRRSSALFTVETAGALAISPLMGPPGTEVTVTGSKFPTNSTLSIKFNDLSVRTFPSNVVSSALGKFMVKFHIPANITEGTYVISVEDNAGTMAIGNFVVTKDGLYISVSQTSTRSGTIAVRGSGFHPNTPVEIKFDDMIVSTTPLKINTTRSGTFVATFNVPGEAPNGNHTVTAIGNDLTSAAALNLKRQYIDDRYGILISMVPEKYDFVHGETLTISGKVLALNNGLPLIMKIMNPNNAACSFQQLSIDKDMNFVAEPVKLDGPLCSVEGEYKITAFYGKGKALTKFQLGGSHEELTGGRAEVENANLMQERFRFDNKYIVDLDWTTNAVLLRNNVNQTITFYLMFVEYDAKEITKKLSYTEVTLEPFEKKYIVAPYIPQIINGQPNGYLHVFAWTSLNSPTPLHPGLYVPY